MLLTPHRAGHAEAGMTRGLVGTESKIHGFSTSFLKLIWAPDLDQVLKDFAISYVREKGQKMI